MSATLTRTPASPLGRPGPDEPGPDADAALTPGRAHRWAAVALLVLGTGAFWPLVGGSDDGDLPLARAVWAVAYAITAVLLVDGMLRLRLRAQIPAALVLFLGLAALSVTWSVSPSLTIRRDVGLVGTIVVGMYLAQRLRPVGLLDALRRALLIVAVASLALWLAGSPLAVDSVHGTLAGVVSTKNTLGRLMALGLLASATTALLDPERIRRCTVSALVMVVTLSLTDSTGGSLVAAAVVLCMGAALLWRAALGRALLVAAVTLSLSSLVVYLPRASADAVTGLVGEDATLTGRTDIWVTSLEAAAQRPLLGYGYGAFWDSSDAAERIRGRLQWGVPSGHNGLLDVGLDLGIVGVALAVLVLATLVVQGLLDLRARWHEGAVLRLSIAALLAVSTMAESGLLQQNVLLTVMLAAALCTPRPAPGAPPWVDGALAGRHRASPPGTATAA